MPIQLSDDQGEQLIRLLRDYCESNEQLIREVIGLQRLRFKPRKRTAIERNNARFIAENGTGKVDHERIRRLLLRAK